MDKQRARDILQAHACCSFVNTENKLCMLCPLNSTHDCANTVINEEVIIKAMKIMKGIKTMKTIKLSEIKITDAFKQTTPNPQKVQGYREYYENYGKQAKPILVDYHNILRDGYIQYLILKENGIEEATIIRKKRNKKQTHSKQIQCLDVNPYYKKTETTYIFGVHPNSKCKREFIWRVPVEWNDWADNLEIGDIIKCHTKFGISPVVVNRVETLDKPPIQMFIKKVASRKICRNEMVVEL